MATPTTRQRGFSCRPGSDRGDHGGSGGAIDPLVPGLKDGCVAYPAGSATGKIVLIARGVCDFAVKVNFAQLAGAAAHHRQPRSAPIPMADDPALGNTIPAAMVGKADGLALVEKSLPPRPSPLPCMSPRTTRPRPPSRRRQRPGVLHQPGSDGRRLPGQAGPHGARWQRHQLDPGRLWNGRLLGDVQRHLDGVAAPRRRGGRRPRRPPAWTAAQVRSAIVNTADQGVIKASSDGPAFMNDPNMVGAGRENLLQRRQGRGSPSTRSACRSGLCPRAPAKRGSSLSR